MAELIIVSTGTRRKWKILGLAMIFFLLISSVIVILSIRKLLFSNSNNNSTIHILVTNMTPTLIETSVTNQDITVLVEDISTNSDKDSYNLDLFLSTTAASKATVTFIPTLLFEFFGYEQTFGLSFSGSLYYNIHQFNLINGYVTSLSLRLFTSWEGDEPLYLFAIETYLLDHSIKHRYPIIPETNNTEWQTIEIPFQAFPLLKYNFLAIGMQKVNSTNQIYAVRSMISIHGKNITNDTVNVFPETTRGFYGAAFTYTVIKDDAVLIDSHAGH